MLNFNIPGIDNIINNIYAATKFKCVIFDSGFSVIRAHPDTMCEFCRLVRKIPYYEQNCMKCDRMGFDASLKTRTTQVYKCHMGLTEVVSPIVCSDSVIGFVMIGQLLIDDCKSDVEKCIDTYPDPDIARNLRAEYQKFPVSERNSVYAAVSIIEMCASYLWLKKLVSQNANTLSYAIRDYISENISDELNVNIICKKFNVSKSTLYSLALNEFGKGISEYIRDVRIEKAGQLLLSSDLMVSEIAEQVGFIDTNYFIKVFKQYNGTTPLKWRNEHRT